ncbi:MAG: tyrosine-protein kinase [Solirubrobacterales bacterium]|jgi:capsular exopolysaccharide synthesis family protein|nr:tyrosine-protein kinase [Solirubrobacterales bacterium]MDX6662561.1 tyrosine-protein kinase [Solirubrobacterales bacterium]
MAAQNQTADWLQPPAEQVGLQRYAETLRERAWLIVLVTLLTLAAAIAYVLTAPKTYQGVADLLITPVSRDNATLTSLGLISDSADPTRDVETAAHLVRTIEVAKRAKALLRSPRSPRDLLGAVSADPVAQSNVVAITASDSTPQAAADLANAFGRAVVADRTASLHREIDSALPGLRAQLQRQPAQATGVDSVGAQLAQMELLRRTPDPTFRLQSLAEPPTRQASPRPVLSIVGGLFAGLVLGVAAAFGLQALDPRLRREAQLRRLYSLPILARMPKERKQRGPRQPLGPRALSSATAEAYRTLRTNLTGSGQKPRTILVTGPTASEGKTTTAVNLASSLALAGNRVILIDADLRRPALAKLFDLRPKEGVVSVLIENTELEDALIPSATHGVNLSLLLADYEGGWIADLFAIPAAEKLIEDAKRLADYVVIDSPPLNDVIDALPLARNVDDVVIVVRLGHSRLERIAQLGEMLAENGVRPAGFAIIGAPRPRKESYSYYLDPATKDNRGLLGAKR